MSVNISGLTIRQSPGGIDFTTDKSLTLTNLKLHNSVNKDTDGGAVQFDGGGALSIQDCVLVNNSSYTNGGAISVGSGTVTISGGKIESNTAGALDEYGGIMPGQGGAIYIHQGNITVSSIDVSPLGSTSLRRLFGDYDNNGTVNAVDFAEFGNQWGLTLVGSPFDYNVDGTILADDFAQFGNRWAATL